VTAEPLGDELTKAIEDDEVSSKEEVKGRAKKLSEKYIWDKNEALKIWAFGPETSGPNILLDASKGV